MEKDEIITEIAEKDQQIFKKLHALFKNLSEEKKVEKGIIEKLKELFTKHPEVLTIQNENGKNLGMIAAKSGKNLEEIVLLILGNHEASIQQDKFGYNIGMMAALNRLEKATLKVLDNHEASIQQNKLGYNIGMTAADRKLEKATLKALDNHEASIQQDEYGENIGMKAALNGLKKAVIKAYQNPVAQKQRNGSGDDMLNIANFNIPKKMLQQKAQNHYEEIDEISNLFTK